MPVSNSHFPARPSLEQLRKQAKELLRAYRANDSAALARLSVHKSRVSEPTGPHPASLADAQFVLAREYGFQSWPRLKRHIDLTRRPSDFHEPTWGQNTWTFLTAVLEADERWSGRPLGDDTPLARARDRELPEIVSLLEEAATKPLPEVPPRPELPPDTQGELEISMSRCGHRGDISGALALLEQRPDLAYAGLYEAVHQGYTKLARLLLEREADPTRPWRWSCWLTPLMHSLRHARPNYEMASMLMDYGVTANDTNGMGMTTLHILMGLGATSAASWLLDRGADINRRDNEFDSTPLAWAARVGRVEVVELLLSRGALRKLPDNQPWSVPAAWARRRGHSQILKML
jgi:hypothetical protein